MGNKRITKTVIRRAGIALLAAVAIALLAGYAIAPSRPYLFVHLPAGGFIGQYDSMAECRAARRAFGAGRGIDTTANLTISAKPHGYVDLCGRTIGTLDAGQ